MLHDSRSHPNERGFSLVELVVVVAVLSILMAIAIPTVIGFRNAAEDRAAQADLRGALVAERTYWLRHEVYTEVGAELVFYQTGAPYDADPGAGVALDLHDADASIVCLSRASQSGRVFSIWENPEQGTFFGESDLTGADCPAAPPPGHHVGGF